MSSALEPKSLEQRLSELDNLGLIRPASTLFSEYLDALVAEGVFEPAAVDVLSAAYHRLRYASPSVDEPSPQSDEAAALLDQTIAKLGAMPDNSRQELAERVRVRLTPYAGGMRQPAATDETRKTATNPAALEPASAWDDLGGDFGTNAQPQAEDLGLLTAISRHQEIQKSGWWRRVRGPLTIALTISCFLGGYAYRTVVERIGDSLDSEITIYGANRVTPRTVWANRQAWVQNLKNRASDYAGKKRDVRAKLAYELLATYLPDDPETNNNLAWLYLTSEDATVRNARRGMDLAMNALSRSRSPVILDTAAEAQYQAGNVERAIELEREALEKVSSFQGIEFTTLRQMLERQLAKFRSGNSAASSSPKPSAGATRSESHSRSSGRACNAGQTPRECAARSTVLIPRVFDAHNAAEV